MIKIYLIILMLIGCIPASAKCYTIENKSFCGKINYVYLRYPRKTNPQEMTIIYNNKNKNLLRRDFEEIDIKIPNNKIRYYLRSIYAKY